MTYPESLAQALVLDFYALEAFMKQQKARGWGGQFWTLGRHLALWGPEANSENGSASSRETHTNSTWPFRAPHPVDFGDSKFGEEQLSRLGGGGPSVPGLPGHRCTAPRKGGGRSPGKTSVAVLFSESP